MDKNKNQIIEKKLDSVIELLRHILALDFSRSGISMPEIAKRLHVATATVVKMLKGIRKEK